MRVLFVQSHTGLGGAETALATLLRYLPREEVAPAVVSFEHGNGELLRALEGHSIPVARHRAGRLRNVQQTFQATRWLARKIAQEDFQVVVSNGGHPNLYTRPATLWVGSPSVWWVHDHSFADPLHAGPLGFLQAMVRADVLVANSRQTECKLRAHFSGVPILTISPGIDLEHVGQAVGLRSQVRQSFEVRDDQRVIGMFARLQRWKGHLAFLEAAALLKREGFTGQFWIVGGPTIHLDPGYEDELRRTAARLGVESQVKFLGARADALALMSATDAVVHASVRPEPYGLVVAEAMALGRPVVATAHGGILEMISHERDGLLVPPGDAGALAAALLRLWRDHGLCARLSAAARLRAEREFSASRTAAMFCALFRQLAARTNGKRDGAVVDGQS